MGFKEVVGVQRKLEGLTGQVFGGILAMVGVFSLILPPSRLGTEINRRLFEDCESNVRSATDFFTLAAKGNPFLGLFR
jgi:hypothetical protein